MAVDSQLGIGITMFLRDQFSGPAAKIRSAAAATKKSIDEIYDEQLKYTRNLSAGMAMIGGAAIMGLGRAIKQGAKFNYAMKFTGIVTGATTKQTEELTQKALKLSTQYMFTADSIAEGMKEMGKAGMGVQETSANIDAAIKLAGSTDTALATTTDMMIATMKLWQLEFTESAKVADLLSYAVNASVIDMPDLAEAMKYVGSTARDTGVNIKETTAMIMTMGQAGIKGSMAGVAIENMLRYLGRALGKSGTGQQKSAIAELGMQMSDFMDEKGNMKSMVTIMDSMGGAIKRAFGEEGAGGIAKQNLLAQMFGVRGKRAASVMLRMVDQFRTYTNELNTSAPGFAGSTTMLMMDTLQGKILTLGHAWSNLGKVFSKSVEPVLKVALGILQKVGEGFSWLFNVPLLGKFFSAGIAGFLVINVASLAFKAVISGIVLIQKQMTGAMQVLTTSSILGWRSQTAAAATYGATVAAVTKMSRSAMAAHLIANPQYGASITKGGRIRNMKTGRFMSTTSVGIGGAAVGASLATKAGTSVIGKFVGMLGGPWGMAIAFIIPGLLNLIISAINKNRQATESNTGALNNSFGQGGGTAGGQRYIQAVEFLNKNKTRIQSMQELSVPGSQRQTMDAEYIKTVRDLLNQIVTSGTSPATVILNIDSQQVAKVIIPQITKKILLYQGR